MSQKLHDFQTHKTISTDGSECVAVFIPTIGESTLEKVVAETRSELEGAEIIIIGTGDLIGIASKYHTQFLEFSQKTWKSIGINRAVETTLKDWMIILDADAIPEKGWGAAMLQEFTAGRQFFTGSVNLSEGNYWMRVYNLSLLHEFSKGKPPSDRKHIPAISLGFTRAFFHENGPLLESINRSEDYEWSLRAFSKGISPYYSPEPSVKHLPVNKATFRSVWKYWIMSGPDNVRIRKQYNTTLKTPVFMQWPLFVLLASPILALVPTFRIFVTSPREMFRNLDLLPAIYLTKIAWCIGIYQDSRKTKRHTA